MYQADPIPAHATPGGVPLWARAWRSVPLNVWALGATSLFTDLSAEMVMSVLPIYLVVQLGFSPMAFGTLDGLYNGVGALARLASGPVVDRWRRHKELAAAGYAVSALCRLGLLVSGPWLPGVAGAIALDRVGKAIRTVPRDVLIADSAPSGSLGYAFGVHRALDACGALLGPVAAFALLAGVPRGFDVVFVASFFAALVGLGVLALFVQNTAPPVVAAGSVSRSGDLAGPLHDRTFRRAVLASTGLAVATISDGFAYLILLERLGFTVGLFPLLYVGTSLSYLVLAVPAGVLADRWGRWRVYLLGYGALLAVYAVLLSPVAGPASVILAVVLLGAYYAATDGVVIAFAGGFLAETRRGTGLAILSTCTSLARLLSSVAFGWAWTIVGRQQAVAGFAVALALAAVSAALALRPPAGAVGESRFSE